MERILHKVEGIIYESSYRVFLALLGGIALVRTGVWVMPNLNLVLAATRSPLTNAIDQPGADHIYTNWLSPAIAHVIGIDSVPGLVVFYLLFSILGTILFVRLINRSLSESNRRTALLIFAMLPVSTTAYYWIGMDSITVFFLGVFLLLRRRPIPALGIGVLLGLHHFEQGFVAIGAVFFALLLEEILQRAGDRSVGEPTESENLRDRRALVAAIAALIGVVVGKAIVTAIILHFDIALSSTRVAWTETNLVSLIKQVFYTIHLVVFSVFGVAWIFVLSRVSDGKRSVPFFLTLAGLMLLIFLVADQTRVLSIVSLPVIAIYVLLDDRFLGTINRSTVAVAAILLVVIPYIWVFGGDPKSGVLLYDLHLIAGSLFDAIDLPNRIMSWPF